MTSTRLTLPIYGLSCGGGGAMDVERVLARTRGMTGVYVNPLTETAYVNYDPALVSPVQLAAAVAAAGFRTDATIAR